MVAPKLKNTSSNATRDRKLQETSPASASTPKKKQQHRKSEKSQARANVQGSSIQVGQGHTNAPSTSSIAAVQEEWSWASITDASPNGQPPVFTKDGGYFFAVSGSSVRVHSTVTGCVVGSLSSGGPSSHQDAVTSVILNPHNPLQLITGSLDGYIKIWSIVDSVLLRTLSVEHPIHFIAAHEHFEDDIFVHTTKRAKVKNKTNALPSDDGLVFRVSMRPTAETAAADIQRPSQIMLVGKTRLPRGLAVSPSGAWLVAVAGHKAYVAPVTNLKAGFTKFVSPEALTCLAFHPIDDYFATGDEKGVIRLWYCLDADMTAQTVAGIEKRAPTTTLHWHAHTVSALSFSSNGSFLLSGGEESVLVIWQTHSGKKEYVPRVGAPIVNIAVSQSGQEEYLLGLADASFAFVGAATLRITRSFAQIKLGSSPPSQQLQTLVPLAVHGLSGTVVLPSSHPSALQIYSPSHSRLVAELEVAPSNRVSRRDEKALEPSRVERVVVSPSGKWMATLDTRSGGDTFRGEVYLKLWQWNESSGSWALNTRIDRPHGLSIVTSMAFAPEPFSLLVTTGQDTHIKTWRLRPAQPKKAQDTCFWVLRSTITFRDEVPTHASWSPDGSLLSVSLGPMIAFYDSSSSSLVNVLMARESCPSVVMSHFLGKRGRYLAGVGEHNTVLWDLATQRVIWHYRNDLPVRDVIAHPQEERLAILQQVPSTTLDKQSTRISILGAHSTTPFKQVSIPFHLQATVWYPLSPTESMSFSLFGITTHNRVVLFGDEVQMPIDPVATPLGLVSTPTSTGKPTLFQDIFGVSAFTDTMVTPASSQIPRLSSAKRSTAIISDVPAYLLPPIDSLYDTLLEPFLQRRPTEQTVANRPSIQSSDELDEQSESMNLDAAEGTILGRSSIQEEEINTLVQLFAQVAVQSLLKPSRSVPSHHPNVTFGTTRRVPTRKTSKVKGGSTPQPAPQESYPSPESTPSLTAVPSIGGKKRRKSQVP